MATAQLDDITLGQDQRLRRSFFLAGLVILCYDHLLTLSAEVEHIWTRKLRRSLAWFFLVRYVALLGNLALIPYLFGKFGGERQGFLQSNDYIPLTNSLSCKMLSTTENAILIIQETFVESTLALRVCAMYGLNRRVYASLLIAAVITVTLGVWSAVGPQTTIEISLPGCHVTTIKEQAIRMAAAWEAQLVCDILILGLTLRRAYTYHWTVGLGSGSIFSIMVRDGAVYFGMICLVNVANIMMLYAGDILTAGSLALFASAISVTMISRLMLNLHEAAKGNTVSSVTLPYITSEVQLLPQ